LTSSAETFRDWLRAKLAARPPLAAVPVKRRKIADGTRA
jgi:hypothetical protein